MFQDSRGAGKGVVSRHLGALRTAKPLTARASNKKRWAPYGGSAFGNSESLEFPAEMAIILDARKSGKCRADGRGRRRGRRPTANRAWGFLLHRKCEMWMRGMTNWRAPYLFVVPVPVNHACKPFTAPGPSPSPQESVLGTPQSLLVCRIRHFMVDPRKFHVKASLSHSLASSSCVARSK